jgi:hypothetical protein
MGTMKAVAELFEGRHFDREVIILCVRWYLRFKLSLRDLVEMMAERGLSMAHTTIMRWVQRYAPEFEKRWRRFARAVEDRSLSVTSNFGANPCWRSVWPYDTCRRARRSRRMTCCISLGQRACSRRACPRADFLAAPCRSSSAEARDRFVADSPLEGDGFELPVPREIGSISTFGEE